MIDYKKPPFPFKRFCSSSASPDLHSGNSHPPLFPIIHLQVLRIKPQQRCITSRPFSPAQSSALSSPSPHRLQKRPQSRLPLQKSTPEWSHHNQMVKPLSTFTVVIPAPVLYSSLSRLPAQYANPSATLSPSLSTPSKISPAFILAYCPFSSHFVLGGIELIPREQSMHHYSLERQ